MVNTLQIFFQLLQVAVGNRDKLTRQLSTDEWAALYYAFKKQSLIGIGFAGISRLPAEQRPPLRQLAQWIHDSEKIKEKNERISRECGELCRQLEKDGMNCCILKGQSNLVNYPEWLRDYRTPGDIDVLMRPKDGSGVRGAIEYCIEKCHEKNVPVGKICYHHMELPFFNVNADVDANLDYTEVEAHHRPSWMDSYVRNKRLQKWSEENLPFNKETANINGNSFPIPTTYFNAVYQLVHIYRHLYEEGIGLRQILDYYFVLKTLPAPLLRGEIMHTLFSFGMKKFASAVMYVLQKVFAMPDEHLLCPPNEKEGKFLLREIMMAGNFGKFDSRIKRGYRFSIMGSSANASGGKAGVGFSLPQSVVHNWEKLKHNFRLIRHYPEEVMWEPVFRIYHFFWRKLELWRY